MIPYAAIHLLQNEARIIHTIAESLTYSGQFQSAIRLLHDANTIWFTGIGKSGLVAQRGASMMRTIGLRSQFIHPVDALHGDMGGVKDGDVIVALSHSGRTVEVLDFLLTVPEITVIGLCAPFSPLANRAFWTLPVDVKGDLPTVSCMAQNAWIDALVVALAKEVEHTLQETHPAGEIGRRLRNGRKDTHTEAGHIEEGERGSLVE